ncbi:short-chain dehydrogenase/reductase SDR [Patulibacter medicamentivorans]|uniref:Short-chain dehydrogenase/reductase SDR n=1 Tax=Patulibacter medicamentivorans TaxID=1097667 RepID=H0E0I2_9ACTN|nr:short-chain dehydrogenase/reductase SDR [Patulibacter medicamentivorans]
MVTGGGRGIGEAIAERLVADGARVVVADVDGDAAAAVAERLGERAAAAACDVGERDQIAGALDLAVSLHGGLDVLFNNAGIALTKPFLETDEQDFERLMRVNVLGVMLGTQEAAKRMSGGGKVVNTASIAGKQGYAMLSLYSATKFAVVALTQANARELAPDGITVNAICPGVVGTEMWKQIDRAFLAHGQTSREGEAFETFSAGILLGRASRPDDLAGIASFLASSDSDYVTGQSWQVDGGMVLQ